MVTNVYIIYCLAGALGGLFMGLIGVGIGPIVVPTLAYILPKIGVDNNITMKIAIMTSLTVILANTFFLSYIHKKNNNINYKIFFQLLPGSIIGAICGSLMIAVYPTSIMKMIFGILLIFVSLFTILSKNLKVINIWPSFPKLFIMSFIIATISNLLGVSDGLLMVPFLKRYNVKLTQSIGTAIALVFPVSLAGAIPLFLIGLKDPNLPRESISYLYIPAFIFIISVSIFSSFFGTYIAKKIPEYYLKNIFCFAISLIGLKMLF